MHHDGALELGMFLGGLLMALVPITISVGLLVWALRQRQRGRVAEPGAREDAA